MAKQAIRVALENGCTEIIVRKGIHHRHRFDVVDLLTSIKRELGGKLPYPKYHPKLLPKIATLRRKSKGDTFDTSRLVIPVGISISGVGRLKGVQANGNR
jgi:hypothetical protein